MKKFLNHISSTADVKKIPIVYFLFAFLIAEYLFLIWGEFRSALLNIQSLFGYLDYQNNWRALDDFVKLKTPFKDYFFEYGWFFLFVQSIAYFLFKQTFFALLVSRYLYLPLLGLFLSFFVAKNFLQKTYLVFIFLLLALFFRTNYDLTSIKHLTAELSLSFIALFFFKKNPKYLLVSGIIAGLAFLTSLEYGLALNISTIFIYFFSLFSASNFKRYYLKKFLLAELAILTPYFLWLYGNNALVDYFEFTWGYMNNFYYISPCSSGSFPRLGELQNLIATPPLLISDVLITFFRRTNFYIVFIFFLIIILNSFRILIKEKRLPVKNLIQSSLSTYGLLIFVRTLDNPCATYFSYGLVPFFLLLTLLIDDIISWADRKKTKKIVLTATFLIILIFSWFRITQDSGYFVQPNIGIQMSKLDLQESEYYPPLGWLIDRELMRGYQKVTKYVEENTDRDDYLYVYPWGPYNNLTGRKSPNRITNAFHFAAGPKFIQLTRQDLELNKPKLIIISLYNNLGRVRYGAGSDPSRYFFLDGEEGPIFSGEGNDVEKYIIENYETVMSNNVAIVMKPRLKKVALETNKLEIKSVDSWSEKDLKLESMKEMADNRYAITGANSSWTLSLKDPLEAMGLKIEFEINDGLATKHLTRYLLNFTVNVEDNSIAPYTSIDLATKERQVTKINFNKLERVETIKMEIGNNTGLIWWLNPGALAVKRISFFK